MILKGKNIIITGAGRGIGQAVAIALAKEGANLGLTSRTIEELKETQAKIQEVSDMKVVLKTADITNYEEVEMIFKEFREELGLFNGVIANAGASSRYDTHKFEPEKFALITDVNINGVFHTFKAAYPHLNKEDKKDKARFVITGSAAYPNAMPKFAAYTASKYAVVGFQKALHAEYKKENINFTMVLPTMVDTKLLRGEKAGDGQAPPSVMQPEDLNDYYVFLLSEDANKISDELVISTDYDKVKSIIADAPAEKKTEWDGFKSYLEENHSNAYDKVRKNWRLVKYLLEKSS